MRIRNLVCLGAFALCALLTSVVSGQAQQPQPAAVASGASTPAKVHVVGVLQKRGKVLPGKSVCIAPLMIKDGRSSIWILYGPEGENVMPQGQSQADGKFTIDVDRSFVDILRKFNQDPHASQTDVFEVQQFALVTLEGNPGGRELARITIDWSTEQVDLGEVKY